MGLIRTILIIIIVYYAFRFIIRYLFPFLLTSYVNKKMNQMGNQFEGFKYQKKRPEGEVTIDYSNQKKKQKPNSKGDYIDYEEIKE